MEWDRTLRGLGPASTVPADGNRPGSDPAGSGSDWLDVPIVEGFGFGAVVLELAR